MLAAQKSCRMSVVLDISLISKVWELCIGSPPTVSTPSKYQYFIRLESSGTFSTGIYKHTSEVVFPPRYFVYKGDALAYLTKTANELENIDG